MEAVNVNCDVAASTPMMWPTNLVGIQGESGQSGESCANTMGCFERNTNERKYCHNPGDGAVYSWTEYGAYYCPTAGGTGECTQLDAQRSDGAFDVHLLDDTAVQDSNRFYWDQGIPAGQERLLQYSNQVESVFVDEYLSGGHDGAFGGWFK